MNPPRPTSDRAGDRGYARRLGIAFALATLLHEIFAGFLPHRPAPPPDERVATHSVTIATRTPAPTPKPTPVPTPRLRVTPAPHYSLAPQIVVRAPAPKAAATPKQTTGGAAAHRRIVHRVILAAAAPAQSLAEGTHSGEQNGGTGTGAGAGTGTGGLGGAGTGTGGTGDANGGETNSAPCGEVFLMPGAVSYRHDGTVVQTVLAKVVEGDGTVAVGAFPYPFTYPAERLNPFVHEEALSPDKGIPVQQPPAGVDISAAPAAVQIVLEHTNPATGTTTLKNCPGPSPAP